VSAAGAARRRPAAAPSGSAPAPASAKTTPAAAAAPARSATPVAKDAPRALDDSALAHLVGYAASRASLEMRKVFARHMAPFDLRIAEFTILMLVATNRDVNQKQLGRALDISPPNMAVTLDRMAERGWIERVRSTSDRRAQHIHLTAAGEALAERTRRISATMEEPALAALSRAERALLIELLRKIVPRGEV
jgi:DNA-binding MarR family transcriptional regulator